MRLLFDTGALLWLVAGDELDAGPLAADFAAEIHRYGFLPLAATE